MISCQRQTTAASSSRRDIRLHLDCRAIPSRSPRYNLRTLTRAHLLTYQADVRTEPIGRETQALRIRAVKRLYGHLVAQGHLLLDPTEGIQEISRRQALARPILSTSET